LWSKRPEPDNPTLEDIMAKEDIWLIIVVVFAILFTGSFGWGLWG
jgi:hypothetical protein